MKKPQKPPIKRITRLLAAHLRNSDRGKKCFDKSGTSLDRAIALGVPLNEPITIQDKHGNKRVVVVQDQFEGRNTAFSAKMFQRYRVADYKEPKPVKSAKPAAPAEAAESEVPA